MGVDPIPDEDDHDADHNADREEDEMSSTPTNNKAAGGGIAESSRRSPTGGILRRRISVTDLLNPNNPWILDEEGGFLTMFNFVPKHLRSGPWSVTATLALFGIMYLLAIVLIAAHVKYGCNDDHSDEYGAMGVMSVMDDFHLAPDAYPAYTVGWCYNAVAFFWMVHVARLVWTESSLSTVAWVSFTLWSWTIVTLRHGLCALAPFVPSVRVACEILRLPVLLSASVTSGVWNLVLMPVIAFLLIEDETRRRGFFAYMTGFRLTQLHVFNVVYAVLNGYYFQPRRPLHLGDLDAIAVYMTVYMVWYYFVLDRIGIHLYPIFSPRAPWVVGSWASIIAICWGGYRFWRGILAAPV
jgi:hypothetical protein